MSAPKVRVGSIYTLQQCPFDQIEGFPYGLREGLVKNGDQVRVVNRRGCPPANTMGHCYIETLDGQFLGLVSAYSLKRRS
jgi:hypothetical protein